MRESTGTLVFAAFVALPISVGPSVASASGSATDVSGLVVAAEGRWGYGGDVIVTETTIEQADGSRVVLHQLGGRVGDIAMTVTHSPPVLEVGTYARVSTDVAFAATGRKWRRLTRVIESGGLAPELRPFVRTTTDDGTGLFWESGCAVIGVEDSGATTIAGDAEIAVIESAVNEWRSALAECSYLDLRFAGKMFVEPRFDGANVIRFREQRWCRPASGDDPEVCHDPAAAALTFLTFGVAGERDGAILDADIEMNGVNFALLADGIGEGGAACDADIGNTLVHELGHFLGLDHTCWDGRGPRPIDHNGDPVPTCSPESQLSAEVRDATMYNFQDCGETKKQSLEADDRASVCEIYARSDDPGDCVYPDVAQGGFCATGNSAGGWLVVLIALAFATRRRYCGGRVPLKS